MVKVHMTLLVTASAGRSQPRRRHGPSTIASLTPAALLGAPFCFRIADAEALHPRKEIQMKTIFLALSATMALGSAAALAQPTRPTPPSGVTPATPAVAATPATPADPASDTAAVAATPATPAVAAMPATPAADALAPTDAAPVKIAKTGKARKKPR
jgi:hypothetical protein